MKELFFFDADCRIGFDLYGRGAGAAELLADMDRFGIDRALVRHCNYPHDGLNTNAELAELLAQADPQQRLTGVWGVMPQQDAEMPEPEAFFSAMRECRIGAITFDPNHAFIPGRMTLGKILDAAQRHRIPVLLTPFGTKWRELYDFLREFPDICAIIPAGSKWGADRYFRPLLENYPNLYLSLADYWVCEGVGELVKTFGADRLLYGSAFPELDQGNQMLQIKHSGIDADAVAKITGKNLLNLVENIQW